jgi:hypothetical protein
MNFAPEKRKGLDKSYYSPLFNNTKRDELKMIAKYNRRVSKKSRNKKSGIKRVEKEILMEYKREVARIQKQKKCKVPTLKQFLDKKFKTRKHHKKQPKKEQSLIPYEGPPMVEPTQEETTTVEPTPEPATASEPTQPLAFESEPTKESASEENTEASESETNKESTSENTEASSSTSEETTSESEPKPQSAFSKVIDSINPFSTNKSKPDTEKTTGGKKSRKGKSKSRRSH